MAQNQLLHQAGRADDHRRQCNRRCGNGSCRAGHFHTLTRSLPQLRKDCKIALAEGFDNPAAKTLCGQAGAQARLAGCLHHGQEGSRWQHLQVTYMQKDGSSGWYVGSGMWRHAQGGGVETAGTALQHTQVAHTLPHQHKLQQLGSWWCMCKTAPRCRCCWFWGCSALTQLPKRGRWRQPRGESRRFRHRRRRRRPAGRHWRRQGLAAPRCCLLQLALPAAPSGNISTACPGGHPRGWRALEGWCGQSRGAGEIHNGFCVPR